MSLSKKQYARLIARAVQEADGSSLWTAEKKIRPIAYRMIRGPFESGVRREVACDVALQAITDAAAKLGRSAEMDDWPNNVAASDAKRYIHAEGERIVRRFGILKARIIARSIIRNTAHL